MTASISNNPLFLSAYRQRIATPETNALASIAPNSEHNVLWSNQPDRPRFGSGFFRGVFLGDFQRIMNEDQDLGEFMDIVDGKTNEKYLLDQIVRDKYQLGEDGSIVIEKPRIAIPRVRHGGNDANGGGGVGSGDGEEGDIQPGDGGDDSGKASNNAGDNKLGPWQHRFSPSEIAQAVGKDRGLPFLKPSEGGSLKMKTVREGIKPVPPGRLDRKRTFRNAIKQAVGAAIAKGEEPDFNSIYPTRPNKRYEAIEQKPQPHLKVAVLHLADVSGSISSEMRNATRIGNRLISYPLKYQYGKMAADLAGDEYTDSKYFGKDGSEENDSLKERFLIYTGTAKEVSEDEYYKTRESGGTMTSSALIEAKKIIEEDYPPSEGWNVYIHHYSDGDTWSEEDNNTSRGLINEMLKMGVRYFGNCHLTGGPYEGDNSFGKMLAKSFKGNKHIGNTSITAKPNYTMKDFQPLIDTFLSGKPDEELEG